MTAQKKTHNTNQQGSEVFGNWLREARKHASLGLRQFAGLIGDSPSNVCNLENGRRPIPTDPAKLRKMADVLGIRENSEDWGMLFGLARRPDQPPADILPIAMMEPVPTLLRTIKEYQLKPDEIDKLLKYVQKTFGKGRSNAKPR